MGLSIGVLTELLLVHLTETWRKAVDSGLTVAVALVDFRKAFDSVSNPVLLEKLLKNFGICDQALGWIASYLMEITLTPCLYPSVYHRDWCSALHCSLNLIYQRSTVMCEIRLRLLIR